MTVTFIYFEKYMNSLFKTNYHSKLMLIASCLKMKGIEAKFFLSDKLGSLPELLDELEFYESDDMFVLLDDENWEYASGIGERMRDTLVEKNTYFLCDSKTGKEADGIKINELTASVNAILGLLGQEGMSSFSMEDVYNIYSRGIAYLSVTDCIGLGIKKKYFDDLAPNTIENVGKELDFLLSKVQDGQEVFLDSDDLNELLSQKEFRKKLSEKKGLLFTGNLEINSVDEKLLKKIGECGFKRIRMIPGDSFEINELPMLEATYQYGFDYTVTLDMGRYDINETYKAVSRIIRSNVAKIKKFNFTGNYDYERQLFEKLGIGPKLGRYSALLNGMECLFTGLYHDSIVDGNIKHLVIESMDELTKDRFLQLTNYMGLNSAIYLWDKEGAYDVTSSNHDVKKLARDAGCLLENFIHIKFQNQCGKVYIDGNYICDIYVKKYAEVNTSEKNTGELMRYTYLKDREDWIALLKNAEDYYQNGTVRESAMAYKLINMCRWVERKSCYVKRMPRALMRNGEFYFCGDTTEACGSVEDMIFETTQKIFVKKSKKELEANCLNCKYMGTCGGCSVFESGELESIYCAEKDKQADVGIYISNMKFLNALFGISIELPSKSVEDYTFFARECKLDIDENVVGTEQYLLSGILLFEYKKKGMYFIGNPYARGVLTLNKDMYFVVKLMAKRVPIENMITIIQTKFNISEESAVASLKVAFDLLRKKGCLVASVNVDALG